MTFCLMAQRPNIIAIRIYSQFEYARNEIWRRFKKPYQYKPCQCSIYYPHVSLGVMVKKESYFYTNDSMRLCQTFVIFQLDALSASLS